MVYEAWNPLVHTVDRFPIPEEWRRFRVVDFGYTNPFVCQWWVADPDGRLFRYRELYGTKRTVRTWAEQINALSAGERIEATICDHDAEDRATLAENDIPTVAARKELAPGIQAVADRLQDAGDGRPRLALFRDALVEADGALLDAKRPTCTEQEFPGYVWPRSSDGRPVKEQPVKENDHGMDATRYMVMYMDKGRIPDADAGDADLFAGRGAAHVAVVTKGEGLGFEIRREKRGHKGFR
jgi:phage terminase large subunit